MIEQVSSLVRGELKEKDIFPAMGYSDSIPEQSVVDMVRQVCEDAYSICRLRFMYDIFDAEVLSKRDIKIGNTVFAPGGIITSYLPGMTSACLFVATAGTEYNEYIYKFKKNGDILTEFVADSVGSVLAEIAVSRIIPELEKQFPDLQHTLPYSPGYCAWNVAQQKLLFSMFPENPCGIHLTDSCLMFPEKSVSGFMAIGKELIPQPYRCEICNNLKCYKNRSKKA